MQSRGAAIGSFFQDAAHWWYVTSDKPDTRELLGVFVAVPLVLTLIWISPIGYEWAFDLSAGSIFESPHVFVSAYTLSYVHLDGQHLFDNILNYWVTVAAIYPLAGVAQWRTQFRTAVLCYVTIAPPAIAWLTLSTLGTMTDQATLGFSGLNATLIGFLLVVLFAAVGSVSDNKITPLWAIVPFALAVTVSLGTQVGTPIGVPMVALVVVGSLGTVGAVFLFRSRSKLGAITQNEQLALLIGGTVATFGIFGALVLVGNRTNVWGHLGGFLFGFTMPYVAFAVVPAATRLLVPE
ncbi:hypothetical protein HUB97_09815 [Halorubraceae archaeon YAN]|nr:hypothetical protein [Halorubraceae archaeon YAN]